MCQYDTNVPVKFTDLYSVFITINQAQNTDVAFNSHITGSQVL